MSDRCTGWRLLLSRRNDGDLSRYEWEALDDHLAGCRDCQEAARSDRMLHLAITREDFVLDSDASRRLDDHILTALGLPERLSPGQRCIRRMREIWACWEAMPNLYLTQIVGGTLAAASLTAVFLLTALHPADDTTRSAGEVRRVSAVRSNEPPVPLESLLDRPSPRAAFLWTIPLYPRPRRSEKPVPPAVSPSASKPQPPSQQHGSLPDTFVRG